MYVAQKKVKNGASLWAHGVPMATTTISPHDHARKSSYFALFSHSSDGWLKGSGARRPTGSIAYNSLCEENPCHDEVQPDAYYDVLAGVAGQTRIVRLLGR